MKVPIHEIDQILVATCIIPIKLGILSSIAISINIQNNIDQWAKLSVKLSKIET
jgi:hypothetical protein